MCLDAERVHVLTPPELVLLIESILREGVRDPYLSRRLSRCRRLSHLHSLVASARCPCGENVDRVNPFFFAVDCHTCGQTTCLVCKKEYASGTCCPEAAALFEGVQGEQRCPACAAFLSEDDGDGAMLRCEACDLPFCSKCCVPWFESHRDGCIYGPRTASERAALMAGLVHIVAKDRIYSANGPADGATLLEDQLDRLRALVGPDMVNKAIHRIKASRRYPPTYDQITDEILWTLCGATGMLECGTPAEARRAVSDSSYEGTRARALAFEMRQLEDGAPVPDEPDRIAKRLRISE
jgi:hypothetical protein